MLSTKQNPASVVIGGGLAGLATATLLARAGHRVRLLEQSQQPGGRARTKVTDGFYLNIGPHALYRSGAGMSALRALGIEPHGAPPPVSGGFAIKGGDKHTFPAGLISLLTTGLFGLSAKLETARLLGSISKIDANRFMNLSAREWVERELSHAPVRELILATFRLATYTNAPDLMSAGTAIAQLQKALARGVLYLHRGWQTLVDGLVEAANQAGVTIENGAKVDVVERGVSGQVRAVVLADGRAYETSTVVIASTPATSVSLVQNGEHTSLAQWAADSVPVRAACLDVALNRLPSPGSKFALGIDAPLYLSVHSATAELAPAGGALIQAAKYLPPDHGARPEEDERELENLLDMVQPGWRDALVHRRFLPDMTVMNAVATARGNGTSGRPGPAVPDVPGLFVAGDWVGPEGLLADTSLASAKQAAEAIIMKSELATEAAV